MRSGQVEEGRIPSLPLIRLATFLGGQISGLVRFFKFPPAVASLAGYQSVWKGLGQVSVAPAYSTIRARG
jgi:hypothetical protein